MSFGAGPNKSLSVVLILSATPSHCASVKLPFTVAVKKGSASVASGFLNDRVMVAVWFLGSVSGNLAMGRVSLCDGSRLQVLVSTPSAVVVGGVVTAHSPQSWPRTAMARVSLWVTSRLHTLVSSPAVVQAAGVVTVQSPHWWTWVVLGMVRVSFSPQVAQVFVSSPSSVAVGAFVCTHSPHSWTWAGSGLSLLSDVDSDWQPMIAMPRSLSDLG